MKYEPERPDDIYRIRLDDGFGVPLERQEELLKDANRLLLFKRKQKVQRTLNNNSKIYTYQENRKSEYE
jgi:hypothetical protein